MFHDYRLFFREYLRAFHTTGSLAPSSRWLAAALARYVPGNGRPRRVLEVGPGTGAVTTQIIRGLGPSDRLDLVELNAAFVQHLEARLVNDAAFAAVSDRVRIFHRPVEQLPREATYDAIVCGLPFNNFAAHDVRSILHAIASLAAPGGTISFFEYIGIRPARALVSRRCERERLRGVGRALKEVLCSNEFRRECVLPNVPPAWVHHMRIGDSG